MYYVGSAIRFEVSFYDWDNEKTDPELVSFRVYDSNYNKVFETTAMKTAKGDYVCDFTPTLPKKHIYEWYGDIKGLPSIKRGIINVSFI